jgi:hypothetical protein
LLLQLSLFQREDNVDPVFATIQALPADPSPRPPPTILSRLI